MSLLLTGGIELQTAANNLLTNKAKASACLTFRVEEDSVTPGANKGIGGRRYSNSMGWSFAGTNPGSNIFGQIVLNGATVSTSLTTYVPGQVMFMASRTDSAGVQQILANNVVIRSGTNAFNTANATGLYMRIGDSTQFSGVKITIARFALWGDYYLTDEDLAALLAGADPSTIGSSYLAWHPPLTGTDGATVTVGDAGLIDAVAGRNLTTILGSGTATWSDDELTFADPVYINWKVSQSGTLLHAEFHGSVDDRYLLVRSVTENPTVVLNGGSPQSLTNPVFSDHTGATSSIDWCDLPIVTWLLPTPVTSGSDTLAVTVGNYWATTDLGPAPGYTAEAVTNGFGQDYIEIPTERTLQWGENTEDVGPYQPQVLFKDVKLTSNDFGAGVTRDSHGVITAVSGPDRWGTPYYKTTSNEIDSRGGPGADVISWAANHPDIWQILSKSGDVDANLRFGRPVANAFSLDDGRIVITPRDDLTKTLAGGWVRHASEVAYKAGRTDDKLTLSYFFDAPPEDFRVYMPGESLQPDKWISDVTRAYLNGCEWIRPMTSIETNTDQTQYPDQLRALTDWNWRSTQFEYYGNISRIDPIPDEDLPDYQIGTNRMACRITFDSPHPFRSSPAQPHITFADTVKSKPALRNLTWETNGTIVSGINASSTSLTVTYGGGSGNNPGVRAGETLLIESERVLINTQTLLNGAIDDSQTLFAVDSVTGFSVGTQFTIDWEAFTCTAVDTVNKTLSASRAQNGTTATLHLDNAPIRLGWLTFAITRGQNGTTAASHAPGTAFRNLFSGIVGADGVTVMSTGNKPVASWVIDEDTVDVSCYSANVPVLMNAHPDPQYFDSTVSTAGYTLANYPAEIWFILAAETGCKLWLNIPRCATDELIDAYADAAVAYYPDDIPLVLEYSNEIWNFGLGQDGKNWQVAILASRKSGIGDGSGVNWGTYRCWQARERFRAKYTAAGRDPSLVKMVACFQEADGAGAASRMQFCADNGFEPDAYGTAPYRNVPAGFRGQYNTWPYEAVADFLVVMQHFGEPLCGTSDTARLRKHIVGARTVFPSIEFYVYESSIQLVYGQAQDNPTVRTHDFFYSPGMRLAQKAHWHWQERVGVDVSCHFVNTAQWDTQHTLLWGEYTWHGQHWGMGDGSDGRADNSLYYAATKASDVNQDYNSVSTAFQGTREFFNATDLGPDEDIPDFAGDVIVTMSTVNAVASVNAVTTSGGSAVSVSTVSATAQVGTVVASGAGLAVAETVNATASVGSVSVVTGVVAATSTVNATASVGAATVNGEVFVDAETVEAVASVGLISATGTRRTQPVAWKSTSGRQGSNP